MTPYQVRIALDELRTIMSPHDRVVRAHYILRRDYTMVEHKRCYWVGHLLDMM